jgi:hypothetical protein
MKTPNSQNNEPMKGPNKTPKNNAVRPTKERADAPASIVHRWTTYWYNQNLIGRSSDEKQNLAIAYGHALDSLMPEELRAYLKIMTQRPVTGVSGAGTDKGSDA